MPPVPELGRPPERAPRMAADDERDPARLRGLGRAVDVRIPVELAGELGTLLGPQVPEDAHVLVGAGTPLRKVAGDPERPVLGLPPSRSDPEEYPPSRHRVGGGAQLRGHDGVAVAEDEHAGPDPDPFGGAGQERERGERLVVIVRVRHREVPLRVVRVVVGRLLGHDDVVGDGDRVEAEALRLPGEPDDVLGGGERAAVDEADAEFHGAGFPELRAGRSLRVRAERFRARIMHPEGASGLHSPRTPESLPTCVPMADRPPASTPESSVGAFATNRPGGTRAPPPGTPRAGRRIRPADATGAKHTPELPGQRILCRFRPLPGRGDAGRHHLRRTAD